MLDLRGIECASRLILASAVRSLPARRLRRALEAGARIAAGIVWLLFREGDSFSLWRLKHGISARRGNEVTGSLPSALLCLPPFLWGQDGTGSHGPKGRGWVR